MIPSEHEEAVALVDWMRYQKLDFWHPPMETYTTSWKQKTRNKQEGVVKGLSDYLIYIPPKRCKTKKAILLWIELKRRRRTLKNGELGKSPSTVQPEQMAFIEKMNTVGNVQGEVCYGSTESVQFIKKFLV